MLRPQSPPLRIDLDLQCWLLTACCALYSEEYASFPELRSLRKAIQDRHNAAIALGLEVVCSHRVGELSRRQKMLTRRLAELLLSGTACQVRHTVVELSRASLNESRRAC